MKVPKYLRKRMDEAVEAANLVNAVLIQMIMMIHFFGQITYQFLQNQKHIEVV